MKKPMIFLAVSILVSGCVTAPSQNRASSQLQALSSASLWTKQATTGSALELAMVEAELGARGEVSFGRWYLGQRTAGAFGTKRYQRTSRISSTNDVMNCSDFSNSAEAQRYFLASGGPLSDAHNLDGDGDGLACEWGKKIAATKKRYSYKAPAPRRATTARRSSSGCYTGPRGGRYTITASGRKNYGGC